MKTLKRNLSAMRQCIEDFEVGCQATGRVHTQKSEKSKIGEKHRFPGGNGQKNRLENKKRKIVVIETKL